MANEPLFTTLRFAYADPPYIGLARKHYRDHPDYGGEVDHAALIARLESEFDGWALSLSMKSLPQIMKLCPDDVLTLAWCRNDAVPMGDHRFYSWEPVIMRPVRNPIYGYVRCHLVALEPKFGFVRPAPANHVTGSKPPRFSSWLFDAAGLTADDVFVDLFPGSGAVGRAWDQWRSQGRFILTGESADG